MIGLVGSPVFPENGVMWYGDRIEVYIRKARKDMEHIFLDKLRLRVNTWKRWTDF